jgi:hypothetical protein
MLNWTQDLTAPTLQARLQRSASSARQMQSCPDTRRAGLACQHVQGSSARYFRLERNATRLMIASSHTNRATHRRWTRICSNRSAHTIQPINPQLAIPTAAGFRRAGRGLLSVFMAEGFAARCHESLPCRTNNCAAVFPTVDINLI